MMKFQLKGKHVAIITSISLAVLATSASATEHHGHGSTNAGPSSRTPMQMPMPMGNSAGKMGEGMMSGGMNDGNMMKSMHDMMHGDTGARMMNGRMMDDDYRSYDTNDDGTTSVEELREGLLTELQNHDADSSGALEIAEFELLNAARIRSHMVDRFQALDEDGDGQVTQDEITAPANTMQRRMDRQAASGLMPGMQGGAMPSPSSEDKN